MAEIINLRQVRKVRDKAAKEALAAANRAKFGRTKAAKSEIDRHQSTEASRLDGHRLDAPDRE